MVSLVALVLVCDAPSGRHRPIAKRAVARAGSDPAECGHRAGHDHHGIEASGAAHKWDVEIVLGMLQGAGWNFEVIQLLGRHLFGVHAHDQMHFVGIAIELLEQALQINRSACAGGGNNEFHQALVSV